MNRPAPLTAEEVNDLVQFCYGNEAMVILGMMLMHTTQYGNTIEPQTPTTGVITFLNIFA